MPRKSASTRSKSKTTSRRSATASRSTPAIKVRHAKTVAEQPETLEIVDSNIDVKEEVEIEENSSTVTVACHLPHGLRFDDVSDGRGGVKTVIFPGVNHLLRGKAGGVLVNAGTAVAVTIARSDWEDILRKHGKERAFVGRNGLPPCLIPMRDSAEFRSSARQDEIALMRHGLEPINPASVRVQEAPRTDR